MGMPATAAEPVADQPTAGSAAAARPRGSGRLFRKYFILILALVTGALLIPSSISLYFSYGETLNALHGVQQEKALAAAGRIQQYVVQVQNQLRGAVLPQVGAEDAEQRRLEFLKLLKQVPDVTDITYIGADGCEKAQVSRLAMATSGECLRDRSADPGFRLPTSTQPYYGPVYFRKETEPYMQIAVRSVGGDKGPVIVADVNLKFMWDVITRIRIGEKGKAYVVDANGYLIADPDISLVLRKTDLSGLAHVHAALAAGAADRPVVVTRDAGGSDVVTAYASVDPLGWKVFVEQPAADVMARLDASIWRTGVLLLGGLVISALVALFLARGMARPIRTLQEGAQLIGAGNLDHAIDVKTGDELEALAGNFNRMTAQLRESYASLERKVEVRTQELQRSLEQQTAISEILRVISASPTDVQPVFETIVRHAAALCGSLFANVFRYDGEQLHFAASQNTCPGYVELLHSKYPMRADNSQVSGRVVLNKTVIMLEDASRDPAYDQHFPVAMRWRRMVGVPMLRNEKLLGVIVVGWAESGPVPLAQVRLLQIFADQAAIAIDNARLFHEIEDKTRELEAANAYKSRFLAAASHDLRQPLHALNLFVGQLRAESEPAERERLVRRVDASVVATNELLDGLLDMTRLDAGLLEVHLADFPVERLLRRIETTFAGTAREKGLRFRVVQSGAWIRSDFMLLERILLNLVSNAIRYTGSGGVVVGCRRHKSRLRLEVWDTGIGIAENQRRDIFEEFYRIQGDTDRRGGLGLGLAIVDRLCRLLGHPITLDSRPGMGSRFSVGVLRVESQGQTVDDMARAASPVDPLAGKLVVVIDDDPLVLEAMRGLLGSWQCKVVIAETAAAAQERIAGMGVPDIIVSDYRLANGATGIQAIESLRAAFGTKVPAILVSGDTAPDRIRDARANGYRLLHKPVPPMTLRAMLNRLL